MTTTERRPDYDFILVGARCAGASTARMLALAGARVLVVDRGKHGADTLSTSCLMRGAVMQLQRWGILPALIAAGTPPVRTTHFHYASRSVSVELRPSPGFDALYAPRRTVLDPLLVAAARAAGAEVQFGARVVSLLRRDDGRVCGVELERERGQTRRDRVTAGRVIGADGLFSSIARWVGAEPYRAGEYCAATIYGYFEGVSVDAYQWFYANGLASGAAPTNDGLATVFAGGPAERVPHAAAPERHATLLRLAHETSPRFAEMLADARPIGALRQFPGLRGFYRKPFGPGWALVGDAGYFRDPNTAHGISDALRDSELLAEALLQEREAALAQYQHTRDAITQRLFDVSDELAAGRWDELRVEQLLREASEGMREGLRVVESFDRGGDHGASMSSAFHKRSSGMPPSRLWTRTDSRSGL
jgi:flavin-dependent dehydrogenase